MRIALFGPPGAGKGTQAARIVEHYGLTHISTGAIIRDAISSDTDLGKEARTYVDVGRLVPGELVRKLAENAIARNQYDAYILDGYPRTLEQARWLTDFLIEHTAPLDAVISLQVDPAAVIDRLSQRRVNQRTGENYHLTFNPPPSDVPAEDIVQRPDDEPESISKRIDVYAAETRPVEDYFRQQGNLCEVDGHGTIDEVFERIVAVLKAVRSR